MFMSEAYAAEQASKDGQASVYEQAGIDRQTSCANYRRTGKHLPNTRAQDLHHAFWEAVEKDNQSFNAAALAGKVDVVGLRGTGMSSHRDPRKCSGYRPSFPGTVAFIKDGKFYIKFDHLDKPRLCKEWSFDPTVLPAPAAEAVLKTF